MRIIAIPNIVNQKTIYFDELFETISDCKILYGPSKNGLYLLEIPEHKLKKLYKIFPTYDFVEDFDFPDKN